MEGGSVIRNEWEPKWKTAKFISDDERYTQIANWIKPFNLEVVRGKDVLDAGCGDGLNAKIFIQGGGRGKSRFWMKRQQ